MNNLFKDVAATKYRMAIWSMALGILAVCTSSFILGLLAIIFAMIAKKNYYTVETATPSTIGLITGIYVVAISVLLVVLPTLIAIIGVVLYALWWVIANLPDIIRMFR